MFYNRIVNFRAKQIDEDAFRRKREILRDFFNHITGEAIPTVTFALLVNIGRVCDLSTFAFLKDMLDKLRDPMHSIPHFYNEFQRVVTSMDRV